jgi:hypothetical protein
VQLFALVAAIEKYFKTTYFTFAAKAFIFT